MQVTRPRNNATNYKIGVFSSILEMNSLFVEWIVKRSHHLCLSKQLTCFALILAFLLSILCTSRAVLAPLKACTVVCGMSDTYLAIESESTVTERGLLAFSVATCSFC